jgi:hypothetical protein
MLGIDGEPPCHAEEECEVADANGYLTMAEIPPSDGNIEVGCVFRDWSRTKPEVRVEKPTSRY